MSSRKAKLELSFRGAPGEKRLRLALGAIFQGKFDGVYDVNLSLPNEGGEGFDKVVAVKTASGRVLDISEAFVNLTVYETLTERPPFEGQDSSPAPSAPGNKNIKF